MAAEGSKHDELLQECLRQVAYAYRGSGIHLNSDQEESLYFWLEDNLPAPKEED